MQPEHKTLGGEIRRRRRELRLTQIELADVAGVSPKFVGDLENDKPTVRLSHVQAVAQALGMDVTLAVKARP